MDAGIAGVTTTLAELGEPAYRSRQLLEAYRRQPLALEPAISAWPLRLRQAFFEHHRWHWFKTAEGYIDPEDATRKWVVTLADGKRTQMVMIPDEDRRTLCMSSQVGCAMACSFCSTGDMGFARNLSPGEIVGQWLTVDSLLRQDDGRGLTQTVFMGMGEPLHNEDNVRTALRWLTDADGLAISPTRFTVSTVGIAAPLERLIEETQVNIAISLHAAESELRRTIVPAERGLEAAEIRQMLLKHRQRFSRQRRLTLEVVVLPDVNTDAKAANALLAFAKQLPAMVNLIPFNPYPGSRYARPQRAQLLAIQNRLKHAGIACFIRRTRGQNILAACGTLNNSTSGEYSISGTIN